ncbi:hypothetical protein KI387_014762, partial [Taxus chinensis]
FKDVGEYQKCISDGPWFWDNAGLFLSPWFPEFDLNSFTITKILVNKATQNKEEEDKFIGGVKRGHESDKSDSDQELNLDLPNDLMLVVAMDQSNDMRSEGKKEKRGDLRIFTITTLNMKIGNFLVPFFFL